MASVPTNAPEGSGAQQAALFGGILATGTTVFKTYANLADGQNIRVPGWDAPVTIRKTTTGTIDCSGVSTIGEVMDIVGAYVTASASSLIRYVGRNGTTASWEAKAVGSAANGQIQGTCLVGLYEPMSGGVDAISTAPQEQPESTSTVNQMDLCGDSITWLDGYRPLMTPAETFTIRNSAINSGTLTQMMAAAPASVDPHYAPNAQYNICVLFFDGNDYFYSADTLANTRPIVRRRFQAFCEERRRAGWKVIVTTMMSRGDTSAGGVTMEAYKNDHNPWVRDHWREFADGIADVGSVTLLGADGACNNATYFYDYVHPTAAGFALIAPVITAAVDRLTAGRRDLRASSVYALTGEVLDILPRLRVGTQGGGGGRPLTTAPVMINGAYTGTGEGQLDVSSTDAAAINKGGRVSLGGVTVGNTVYPFALFEGVKANSNASDYEGVFRIYITKANSDIANLMLEVTATGVRIPSLAGTGSRTVVASATGVLSAP